MHLILHDLTPIHWAIAGAAIGMVTLMLLFVGNRRLGISTGFDDACSLVLKTPYFRSVHGGGWRLQFLGGLVLGGALSAVLAGGWEPTWALGRFDEVIGWGAGAKVVWMFVGGLFIGFGTRLAGGCTSGHGIFGVANLETASLVSTASFMVAGVITTQLIYRVAFNA